jgi:uncharacterized protein (DUF305 family)
MSQNIATRVLTSALMVCTASAAIATDARARDSQAGQTTGTSSSGMATSGGNAAAMQMHQAMQDSMKEMHALQPTGDPDRDFAAMMEHHHKQAVKMTQAYLKGAKDPKLTSWAQKSLQSQQKELEELRALKMAPAGSR